MGEDRASSGLEFQGEDVAARKSFTRSLIRGADIAEIRPYTPSTCCSSAEKRDTCEPTARASWPRTSEAAHGALHCGWQCVDATFSDWRERRPLTGGGGTRRSNKYGVKQCKDYCQADGRSREQREIFHATEESEQCIVRTRPSFDCCAPGSSNMLCISPWSTASSVQDSC